MDKSQIIKELEDEIKRLQVAVDVLKSGSTDGALASCGSLGQQMPRPTKNGHVSEAARLRLKEEMRLRWAWRKADTPGQKKSAKDALEKFIAENRPKQK